MLRRTVHEGGLLSHGATMRKIVRYAGKYRARFALAMGCAAVSVALSLMQPVLTGRAIDRIIAAGRVDFSGLFQIVVQIGLCALGSAAAQWEMNVMTNGIAFRVVRDIRLDAFDVIARLPLRYLDAHPAGELVSRVIGDADRFSDGLLMGFSQLFTGVLTILGTLGLMFATEARVALVVLLVTPLSLVVTASVAKRSSRFFQREAVSRAEQTALVDELIAGQRVVKAFGRERETIARFDEVNEAVAQSALKAIFTSSIAFPATRFVNALVYLGVGVTGALMALSGGMTVGTLTCFLTYANQYTKPFNEISGVMAELTGALNGAKRIFELIEQPPEPHDAPDAVRLESVYGAVALKDVSFSYRPDRPLLEHVHIEAAPGQRIAIVGPTGCGKTTLINLLMRFYDVDAGAITLDGIDIRTAARRDVRRAYGMVLQDTWLRSGTILDNIRIGRPDASDEEVVDAAKAVHANGFIERLRNGYHTVVAEDDEALSQGQKQLLCIARVMLSVPSMLILDEATSSIDTRTERKIQDAFSLMMAGRTSFVVAHRLSTVESADVILVMRGGRIVEQGTHAALLEAGGFYAELYSSQFAHV